MATPQGQPQFIVISDGGKGMNAYETVQLVVLVAGLGLGGYVVYEVFFNKDPCGENSLFGSSGLLGFFTPYNPLCLTKSVGDWIKGLHDIGVGVPVQLEPCPEGWSNDGLTCRNPITCASGWDFFTQGCSGGQVVGRLNNGGVCPADHPEKIDGLCYRRCPEGEEHTAGMPYTCHRTGAQSFWGALGSGFHLPFGLGG